jgi:preprotein translocase subunit YajC
MLIWTSLAYAQGAPQETGGGSLLLNLIPFVLIILIFYFLLIRPQSKERKRHAAMVEALKKGDRVTTVGGLIGTIQSVDKDTAVLQVADNVRVRILRSSVTALRGEE